MTVHPDLTWYHDDLNKVLKFCDLQMTKYTDGKDLIVYTTHKALAQALLGLLDEGKSVKDTWQAIQELNYQKSPELAEKHGRPWGFADELGHWFLIDKVRSILEPHLRNARLI